MKMMVVLTTVSDAGVAKKIAAILLKQKLAACVSWKDGFKSLYRWKGRLENTTETLMFIKSVGKHFKKIKTAIQSAHSYDLPEIIALPVTEGSPDYLAWVNREVE
jgi:periplasmic divalent cation tolerance protein